MLVFGDQVHTREPRAAIEALAGSLVEVVTLPAGLGRHAALVGAFVEASEIAQGIADAEVTARGVDGRGYASDVAMTMLVALARDIVMSWDSRFATTPHVPVALSNLRNIALPDAITTRRAEGYAFYAVYPEAYLAAARRATELAPGPRRVIGIRSIGTGLAAMVAVATDAPLPASVRPGGDPYRRAVEVHPALVAELTSDPAATISIVDEGPGLSGSSFGSVMDLLETSGVAPDRIECYPSHPGGLGSVASPQHRERWHRVRRHPATSEGVLAELPGWLAGMLGPLEGPLEDLSAGAWRPRHYWRESDWPPSVTYQERRKYLARSGGKVWLARFVGLGRDGERAAALARKLHAAGFTPEVAGYCHGFLVERWLAGAHVLDPRRIDRRHLVDFVGSYLGFRAANLSATADRGASVARLVEMIRCNTSRSLGADIARCVDRFPTSRLDARVHRVEIDGRLHAWEWLVDGDLGGATPTLVKTDALDHHAAHDLVGCQDITWDLAGAEVELGLSRVESARLAAIITSICGRPVDPELLAFARAGYLAFQLGRTTLAIDAIGGTEAGRLRAAADRYKTLLRAVLADQPTARFDLRVADR